MLAASPKLSLDLVMEKKNQATKVSRFPADGKAKDRVPR